jgi:phosphatidylinositol glycan class K
VDLYGDNIEVDYRGYDVNVENFVRVLTGRVEAHVANSKKLMSDERSNVLIYLTGHGGEDFLKFQDNEELGAQDVADAIAQMWEKRRYHELMFMIDTCQASSMFSRINSPNVIAASSSRTGEPSYSHHADTHLGVAVIDRFTYYNLEIFEKLNRDDKVTVKTLVF